MSLFRYCIINIDQGSNYIINVLTWIALDDLMKLNFFIKEWNKGSDFLWHFCSLWELFCSCTFKVVNKNMLSGLHKSVFAKLFWYKFRVLPSFLKHNWRWYQSSKSTWILNWCLVASYWVDSIRQIFYYNFKPVNFNISVCFCWHF